MGTAPSLICVSSVEIKELGFRGTSSQGELARGKQRIDTRQNATIFSELRPFVFMSQANWADESFCALPDWAALVLILVNAGSRYGALLG